MPLLTSPRAISTVSRAWPLTGSRGAGIKFGPSLMLWRKWGGRLFFLWDELDTASDDPDTELRLHELVARAEREAERTSRRYKLVAEHRARKGLHHGSGRRAYGHTRDYRGLVDEEAARLLEAAKAVDRGKAIWTITEEWTQTGVPTAAGGYRWHAKYCRMEVRAWLGAGWWALILPGGGVVEVQPAGAVQGSAPGSVDSLPARTRSLLEGSAACRPHTHPSSAAT